MAYMLTCLLLRQVRLCYVYTVFQKKLDPLLFHENLQKYIGGVACCEYEINVCDSLTVRC